MKYVLALALFCVCVAQPYADENVVVTGQNKTTTSKLKSLFGGGKKVKASAKTSPKIKIKDCSDYGTGHKNSSKPKCTPKLSDMNPS